VSRPLHSEDLDLFLSYHSADRRWVEKLARRIEAEGFQVFFAPWDILPGQNFIDRIEDGLSKARYFAVVLSPEAIEAEWPTAERAAALLSDPSGRLGRVIPILRRECQIPPFLAFRNYLDFRKDVGFETGLARLIGVLRGDGSRRTKTATKLGKSEGLSPLPAMVDAGRPDPVREEIYGNLLPVKDLPEYLWSAPTQFTSGHGIWRYFGPKRAIPPYILKEGRIFTFADLTNENNPFVGVFESFDVWQHSTSEWIADEEKARWLVELLNDAVRSHCFGFGLSFDRVGKKHYFKMGSIQQLEVSWVPHLRKGTRNLIIEYPKKDAPGETGLYAHRAVGLRFELLGGEAYVRAEPGWIFSSDGVTPLEGRRRSVLSTKFLSSQRNLKDFGETRFWAWLLSHDGNTIKMDLGGPTLEIDVTPVSTTIEGGIFGDQKPLPDTMEEPPSLFEDESEEEHLGTEDGD
jgi:hypothetical protein